MAQRAEYCIKKKEKEVDSTSGKKRAMSCGFCTVPEVAVHGESHGCRSKCHIRGIICALCDISPSTAHVRGPVTRPWLPQTCLLLAQLQEAQHWCLFLWDLKLYNNTPFPCLWSFMFKENYSFTIFSFSCCSLFVCPCFLQYLFFQHLCLVNKL